MLLIGLNVFEIIINIYDGKNYAQCPVHPHAILYCMVYNDKLKKQIEKGKAVIYYDFDWSHDVI
jgi:hypothetical protein